MRICRALHGTLHAFRVRWIFSSRCRASLPPVYGVALNIKDCGTRGGTLHHPIYGGQRYPATTAEYTKNAECMEGAMHCSTNSPTDACPTPGRIFGTMKDLWNKKLPDSQGLSDNELLQDFRSDLDLYDRGHAHRLKGISTSLSSERTRPETSTKAQEGATITIKGMSKEAASNFYNGTCRHCNLWGHRNSACPLAPKFGPTTKQNAKIIRWLSQRLGKPVEELESQELEKLGTTVCCTDFEGEESPNPTFFLVSDSTVR